MFPLKRLISRAGRNRAFPRRLPEVLGGARIYASTEGGLKYLRRDFMSIDPSLTNFALEHIKPGDSVWDIGANLGLFTFTAAGLAGPKGKVFAIEPDTWLVMLLRRAASVNNGAAFADVRVLPVAVSRSVGIAPFFLANQSRATNALIGHGNSTTGGVRELQYVPTFSLDSLLEQLPAPDIVKVDVEHAEVEVLLGGLRLLSQVRPVMLLEVSPDNQDFVTEILVGSDYQMFDGELGGQVDRATWTTIAIPNPQSTA